MKTLIILLTAITLSCTNQENINNVKRYEPLSGKVEDQSSFWKGYNYGRTAQLDDLLDYCDCDTNDFIVEYDTMFTDKVMYNKENGVTAIQKTDTGTIYAIDYHVTYKKTGHRKSFMFSPVGISEDYMSRYIKQQINLAIKEFCIIQALKN
jgi:hypothetical protein